MKTTQQTKYSPEWKAEQRKADQGNSKMLAADAKREELTFQRLMKEMEPLG